MKKISVSPNVDTILVCCSVGVPTFNYRGGLLGGGGDEYTGLNKMNEWGGGTSGICWSIFLRAVRAMVFCRHSL
jgi:hypothetical protein